MQLTNPAQDRARIKNTARLDDVDVERLVIRFERAFQQQQRRDADIARSIIRILRDDVRGLERGPAYEIREFLKEIVREA